MHKILLSYFIILLSLNAKTQFDLTKSISVRNEFTISLPSNWVEIPDRIKLRYSKNSGISIDYGFQPKGDEWFEDAYIVIQKNFDGKISERNIEKNVESFDNARTLKESLEKVENKIKERIGLTIDNEIISKFYDDKRKTYWVFALQKIQGMGSSMSTSILQFTNNGFFQITCVTHTNNFDRDLILYEQIINSFKVDDRIKY